MTMSCFSFLIRLENNSNSSTNPLVCRAQDLPALTRHEEHDWKDVDCVFCCLPHATTQEIISQLPEHLKAREECYTRECGKEGEMEAHKSNG